MTISSQGYAGDINATGWAQIHPRIGTCRYGVEGLADWQVTAAAGTRNVQIAAGAGWGYGVRDVNSAPVVLSLAAAVSGVRWWMIVAHRDWAGGATTFTAIDAGATMTIPTRAENPGTTDDQPLALVRVGTGTAIAEIRDLRTIAWDGGIQGFDELALQYMTKPGTVLRIGNFEYHRYYDSLGALKTEKRDITPDTGWVEAVRNSGWVWTFCQVRRIGGTVFYRMAATRAVGWTFGNGLGIVPDGFRPDQLHYVGNSHALGNFKDFRFGTDGNVVATNDSAGATGVTIAGSYPAAN
jgi:hypothetical protein